MVLISLETKQLVRIRFGGLCPETQATGFARFKNTTWWCSQALQPHAREVVPFEVLAVCCVAFNYLTGGQIKLTY